MAAVTVLDVVQTEDDGTYCVLLHDPSHRVLPIFIGPGEALAIAALLRNTAPGRPLTHRLMGDLIGKLGAELERVSVEKVEAATFHARLFLKRGEERLELDCRASDAVALALNTGSPIQVAEELMRRAERYPQPTEPSKVTLRGAAEILDDVLQRSGSGPGVPRDEQELSAFVESRRAFVAHINRLISSL